MGALLSPDRPAVLQPDVLCRTDPLTLSAGNAGIRRIKFLCVDTHRIKQVVYNPADQSVRNRDIRFRKFLAASDHGRRLRDPLLCLFNDFARRFPCGRGKHGNIVFRHDDRQTAPITHSFLCTQSPEIFPRISDVFPAGHHEIDIPASRQLRPLQPFLQNARDSPRIGGRNHHPGTAGCDPAVILIFQPFEQVQDLICRLLSDPFRCMFAVSCS